MVTDLRTLGWRVSIVSAAMLGCAVAPVDAQTDESADQRAVQRGDAGTLHLFEDAVPAGMSAGKGTLAISADHYKDGRHSLKWSIVDGSPLTITHPFVYRAFVPNPTDQRRFGLAFWIYNSVRSAGTFRFQFYRGGEQVLGFTMNADFTGWRAAAIPYETDMTGKPVPGMDRLVVTPPAGMRSGDIYFDQMGLDFLIDPRHPAADYQFPMLNTAAKERANAHWTAVLLNDSRLRSAEARRREAHGAATPTEITAITRRIDAELLIGKSVPLAVIEREFKDLHNADGSLKALAETSQQWPMYRENGVSKAQLAFLRETSVTWRNLGKIMKSVAIAYRQTTSRPDRQRLQTIFRQLVRHQSDQGLVRGSGQGVLHHQGYQMAEWSDALFLMRDAMGEDTAIARESMAWFSGLGRIYEPTAGMVDSNADVMNTFFRPMLFSVLMDGDARRRGATLMDFSGWVSAYSMRSAGTGGGIKPDGSVFHHSQHYVAYGNGALTGLTETLYFLSGTPFRIAAATHERVRRAVLMTRVLSNRGKIPMSLAGRHVEGDQSIVLAPFRYMALAGDPSGSGPDRDMAGAFLRLAQGPAAMPRVSASERATASQLLKAGMTTEPAPTGSWTMNYSSLALHRRDGWLISARGFSRYLVGNETYPGKNMFGRTINYGSLEFLPADPSQRGYAMPGWDWSRWPGTTAKHLSIDRMRGQPVQVDEESGVEEMLLSEQTYSGGLDFRGRQAMFAMKLQGHPKYGDDLLARKSYFFFDGRVIALGSGISASESSAPVQTTVFQDQIMAGRAPAAVEGIDSVENGTEIQMRLTGWRSARDENGNGICLAPGQTVLFRRGEQESIDAAGVKPTVGRFATLAIDHGAAPSNGSYEYAFLLQTGSAQTQDFCHAMNSPAAPYTVLSRSDRAHVVLDAASGLTGYALFEAGEVDVPGVLTKVSSPSMLMLKVTGTKLEGAFVNPDLNLYEGRDRGQYDAGGKLRERSVYALPWRMSASKPVPTRVTFKGRWRSADPMHRMRVSYDGKGITTTVVFDAVEATPIQFTLVKG